LQQLKGHRIMTTDVEKAEQTLARLDDKRRALVQRATELADERQRISYAAHAGNDKKSRQRLDEITAATVAHQSEMASIESAIAEATNRLATAKHNATLAADREQAIELGEVLETFAECGRDIDAALTIIIERSRLMEKTLHRMNALGAASPNRNQLETLGALALHTALMQTPWTRDFRHLAPGERRTFNAMVDAWYPVVEANIASRLGNEEAA
jgi:hypothetical protein